MDLWDRLCTALRVREVTVEDSSRWGSMDLRLLLGAAHGTSWFGRWGYEFRAGSYGTGPETYQSSVDHLGSTNLDRLMQDQGKIGREGERLQRIIAGYRRLARASPFGPVLLTSLSDLLRFLLDFRARRTAPYKTPFPVIAKPVSSSPKKRRRSRDFDAVAEELDSRWPARRLKVAAQVIVEALAQRPTGMTRQEVRDAARITIGDTGLLDFVLKSIGDCAVGARIVRRSHNPVTRVLEFSLESNLGEEGDDRGENSLSRQVVERDIAWVYRHILVALEKEAAEAALNCKRWGKVWGLRDEEDDRLRFLCGWKPEAEERGLLRRPLPPAEVLVMPPHATVGDLRKEAERAMRDTYCAMRSFRAMAMEGVAGEDGDPLFGCGAESGGSVWVRGEGVCLGEGVVCEGGEEIWKVRCACGARDDDGERMVACDICEVWQHTRCAGIADGAEVPSLFLCWACGTTVLRQRTVAMTNALLEEKAIEVVFTHSMGFPRVGNPPGLLLFGGRE
ncbi:PHD finger protein MALE MEIOCYTE DEATH 1-like [Wolffia australiana]